MNAAGTQVAAGGADKTLLRLGDGDRQGDQEIRPRRRRQQRGVFARRQAPSPPASPITAFTSSTWRWARKSRRSPDIPEPSTRCRSPPRAISSSRPAPTRRCRCGPSPTAKSKTKLEHGAAVQALALSKDGARVAAGGADKTVKVWTLADGKPQATIATPAAVHGVALQPGWHAPAGRRRGQQGPRLRIDGQLVEFFPHEGPVLAVAFHGDGKRRLHRQRRQDGAAVVAVAVVAGAPRRPGAAGAVQRPRRSRRLLRRRQDDQGLERRRRQARPVARRPRRSRRRRRRQRRRHAPRLVRRRQDGEGLRAAGQAGRQGRKARRPHAAGGRLRRGPQSQRSARRRRRRRREDLAMSTSSTPPAARSCSSSPSTPGRSARSSFLADNRTLVSAGADKIGSSLGHERARIFRCPRRRRDERGVPHQRHAGALGRRGQDRQAVGRDERPGAQDVRPAAGGGPRRRLQPRRHADRRGRRQDGDGVERRRRQGSAQAGASGRGGGPVVQRRRHAPGDRRGRQRGPRLGAGHRQRIAGVPPRRHPYAPSPVTPATMRSSSPAAPTRPSPCTR